MDLKKKEILKLVILLAVNVLVYTIIFSIPSFKPAIEIKSPVRTIINTLVLVNFNLILFTIFSSGRRLFLSAIFIFFMIGFAGLYYSHKYNVVLNYYNIALIFNSDLQEKLATIDYRMLLLTFFGSAFVVFLNHFFIKKFNITFYRRNPIVLLCVVVIIPFIYFENAASYAIPQNIFRSVSSILFERAFYKEVKDFNADDFSFSKPAKDLNIVIIIGESMRANRLALNGYERETNPLLSKLNNLVSFPDTWSCGGLTAIGVPCIMLRDASITHNGMKSVYTEKSFISAFNKLGFETYWYGNQKVMSFEVDQIINEPKHSFVRNSDIITKIYDHELADKVREKFIPDSNNLYIIHFKSNHFGYSNTYPPEFGKFNPICGKWAFEGAVDCTNEQLGNEYDNGVLYNDYAINKVIDFFKDKKALIFFISDHGESLGEGGYYFHADRGELILPEMLNIAFIAWASDEYIKNYPSEWKNLISKKDKKLTQAVIFNSVLGCSGVKSNLIDAKNNLCQ